MTNLFNYGYDHKEIRDFAANEANGTICEAALLAVKNLESAIYKRKAITSTEWEAVKMLMQCAEELYWHAADKPIDNTRSMLPREMREGLKREIALEVISKSSRYTYNVDMVGERIDDSRTSKVWRFNTDARVYLWTC